MILIALTAAALSFVAPAAAKLAREVIERGGVIEVNGFARCEVPATEGGEARHVEIMYHAEGKPAETSGEQLASTSTTRVHEEATRLLGDVPGRSSEQAPAALSCDSIAAPDGDVDHELMMVVEGGETRVEVIDVRSRNDLAMVSDSDGTARCERDAMGQTFCATGAYGVAVVTTLGRIACARGQCVRHRSEWHCSRRAGGWAELTPRGPQCEHGCYSPTERQCNRV
jgi:hypothetical protein